MKRYNVNDSNTKFYEAADGEWVKYEDVKPDDTPEIKFNLSISNADKLPESNRLMIEVLKELAESFNNSVSNKK